MGMLTKDEYLHSGFIVVHFLIFCVIKMCHTSLFEQYSKAKRTRKWVCPITSGSAMFCFTIELIHYTVYGFACYKVFLSLNFVSCTSSKC